MIFNELNDDNYLIFAIKHYDNPQAVTYEDFLNDMKKFKYIKRLLRRYETQGDFKVHLILNHIIILYNAFGDAATPLLFFKIDASHWSILKAFMYFLDRLPPSLNTDIDQECLRQLNLI